MPKWIDLNKIADDEFPVNNDRIRTSIALDDIKTGDEDQDTYVSPLRSGRMDHSGGDSEVNIDRSIETGSAGLNSVRSSAGSGETDYLDVMAPAKKSMTIFFLIDVSGSMKGTRIGSLNSTMEELLPSLIGVGEASTDVKIAIMKFSTNVEWVTKEPVRIEEYQYWNRLEAEGLTFMGDAFLELSSKLSRSSFLNSPSLSYAPVIFLLSDGAPNDDWRKGLETLRQNRWFQYGLKIALGIGSEVDMDVLREFTGNDELAVQAKNADQLRELIKLMAVTSSQIGSRSMALVNGGRSSGDQPARTEASAKQQVLVEEIRAGARDILGEGVDMDSVDFDEGW